MQAAIASGMRTVVQKPFRVALCQVGHSSGAYTVQTPRATPVWERGAGVKQADGATCPKDVPAAGAPSQMLVTADKQVNLAKARSLAVDAAMKGGAKVVVLPECFNSPYGVKYFRSYAEHIPEGESTAALRDIAREAGVVLVGGSIPEKDTAGKLYNTCLVFDGDGEIIAKHRKIHLFDVDIKGKITFKESDALSPGNSITIASTPYGKFGIGICYDIRFPELAMIAARRGCIAMFYPGAFNMITGPLHWELLIRARAVDNGVYVAACSPARDTASDYHAWGHSTLVDPSGNVLATTEEGEEVVYGEIYTSVLEDIREGLPVTRQRRFDVYPDVSK